MMVAPCLSIARGLLASFAAAGVAGCLGAFPPPPEALEHPVFRPEVFFAGRTQGIGRLERVIGRAQGLQVESHGRTEPDGSFRLDQAVRFDDGTVQQRTWRMQRTGPTTYAATLSDAAGPVSLEVAGNRLQIRYLLRHPAVYMHQRLDLRPDGRTALNRATVSVLGIPWARLTEEITQRDAR
jgi:hypothetical protein